MSAQEQSQLVVNVHLRSFFNFKLFKTNKNNKKLNWNRCK